MKKNDKRKILIEHFESIGFERDAWGNYKKMRDGKLVRIKFMTQVARFEVKIGERWIRLKSYNINQAVKTLTKSQVKLSGELK